MMHMIQGPGDHVLEARHDVLGAPIAGHLRPPKNVND